MSSDYIPVLVSDKRMDLHSKLDYEVYSGANSVAPSRFTANTNSPNNLNFTITCPSFETILDACVWVDTDILWSKITDIFHIKYNEIQSILEVWLKETYNLEEITVSQTRLALNFGFD